MENTNKGDTLQTTDAVGVTETASRKIKFLMHAVKFGNERVRVWYGKGGYTEQSGIAEDTISIHARDYKSLPVELNPENNTDTQTDYFDNDTARITTDSPYYEEANKAYLKAEAKRGAD